MAKAKKQDVHEEAPATATAGHNAEPAPDAVKALNIAKLMAADILFEEAKADHKWIKKHVEAKGVNVKAYAVADKIIKSGKVTEAIHLFGDVLEILRIRGNAVPAAQIEMLLPQGQDGLTPADERAATEGRYAGIMGLGIEANPYGPVGEQGQAWIAAFYAGEKERELILALEPGPDSELIRGDNDEPGDDPFADSPELEAAE